jgi:signal transduction histidine kinase
MRDPESVKPTKLLLLLSGLLVWGLSGPQMFGEQRLFAAWLLFPVPFGLSVQGRFASTRGRLAAVGLQTAAALVLGIFKPGLPLALFAVISGQLPLVFGRRLAIGWLVAQTLGFSVGLWGRGEPIFLAVSYFAFELFAFGAAFIVRQEAQAREELARTHAELEATQTLLEQSARQLERQRISRELHDSVGHHLTALSLQLEVAKNLVEGSGRAPVLKAQELSREALAEVRAAVGTLRELEPLNLAVALEALRQGFPGLSVQVTAPGAAAVQSSRVAHAVLRCVQEAATNAARHAQAKNLWVRLEIEGNGLRVQVRDDGRGVDAVRRGNGLTGLNERLAELGGTLETESSAGRGFVLTARLPLENAP